VHSCTCLENEESMFHVSHHHLTCYTYTMVEMALFSNVMIHGSTFNSAQGDFHIHNMYSESGMHDFRSVQKSILIDDPVKDFIP
jgi:hypothetical protein